ncbi:MAG: insulinase family protein [Myxococcales bacterium]|nr:insulinase family protein [Myxococcales bacterium]
MKTNALLLALALATPAGALAASPPPAAEAPKVDVETWSLDNGLTVLLSRDTRLPVVAVEVRYLVGAANERPGRSGFAHLFEHLMFQGSEHFDDEYFTPFEPIGGAVNGTTNSDRTNYFERVPREYLELALWMESDRMASLLPALTQQKLDNQRDVVKNERRQSYEDRPYGMVWLYFAESLFPKGHPYDHTAIGSHEDLTAASLEDVKGFFRQYYVPANAVLTVVGDFEPAQAKALIQKYFGGIPAGERAPKPEAAMPKLTKSIHRQETDEVKLPRIYLAWHTPALYADGDAAMDILASVLTDGKTSRLYQPLVYEQKIAKDVAAFQVSNALSSFFVIQATAAPGKTIDELSTALDAALAKALSTPPSQDEMARVLNGWRKSFYGRVEGVLSRAMLLSGYYHLTGKPDYLAQDLARYTSLDAAAVHAAAQKWLTGPNVRIDISPKPEAATPATPAEGGAK